MESRPLVYIRADGNETIATGHLMRCLTIARALVRRGAVPTFIVSDTTSISLLQKMMTPDELIEHVFSIIHLQTDFREPDNEIPVLRNLLTSHPVSCVLVDSYYVSAHYLSELKQFCRVAYLDDLQAFDYPVNLIINYDMNIDTSFYKSAEAVLTGCAYTPLREQFSLHAYHPWENVRDIFLSTGGTDPFDIAGGLAAGLLADPVFKDACLHLLTGPMHVHRAQLEELSRKESRVILHENVTEMAALMSECDLAVSAGGTTLYELCAVGVPAVSYSMADNQLPGVLAFDNAGLIPYIGDVRNNPAFYERALAQLRSLALDAKRRSEQSLRMRMTIDGAGADRIAAALITPIPS